MFNILLLIVSMCVERKEVLARRMFVFPPWCQPSLRELERFVRSVFGLSSLFLLIVLGVVWRRSNGINRRIGGTTERFE